MAKIFAGHIVTVRGKFTGFSGMHAQSADKLHTWADRMTPPRCSAPEDDPRWLTRRARRLRLLAEQKERALEHKANQRKTELRHTRIHLADGLQ